MLNLELLLFMTLSPAPLYIQRKSESKGLCLVELLEPMLQTQASQAKIMLNMVASTLIWTLNWRWLLS